MIPTLLLLGCSALFPEPPPLAPFIESLLAHTGSKLAPDQCNLAEEGPEARCTLVGSEGEATRFVDRIRDKPLSGRVPGSRCQSVGYLEGWSIDPDALPPTEFRVRRVFRHLGRVCIDLDIPAG